MAKIGKNIDSEGYDWDEDDQDRIGFMKECEYLEENELAEYKRENCDDRSQLLRERYDYDDGYDREDRDDDYLNQQPGTAPMIDLQKLSLQKWECDEKTRLEENAKVQERIVQLEAENSELKKNLANEKEAIKNLANLSKISCARLDDYHRDISHYRQQCERADIVIKKMEKDVKERDLRI
jgi:hypothetical protein